MTRRRACIVAFALVILPACAALTAQEEAHVAIDATQLGTCVAEERMCKRTLAADASVAPCYAEYDDCMTSHGFRDAGAVH
jgi:hypothetical protein